MTNIAYIRISDADTNDNIQRHSLSQHNIDEWFTDKVSVKNKDRPQLQEMIHHAKSGDKIYVHDFSRLASSTSSLLKIICMNLV